MKTLTSLQGLGSIVVTEFFICEGHACYVQHLPESNNSINWDGTIPVMTMVCGESKMWDIDEDSQKKIMRRTSKLENVPSPNGWAWDHEMAHMDFIN